VAKHLVDLDEAALTAARAEVGTDTIKDTVNAALRRAGRDREDRVKQSLAVLSRARPG
jgi:Arc/MetJ family transcription regulator